METRNAFGRLTKCVDRRDREQQAKPLNKWSEYRIVELVEQSWGWSSHTQTFARVVRLDGMFEDRVISAPIYADAEVGDIVKYHADDDGREFMHVWPRRRG